MKKTIAILLVLAVVLTGAFAADAKVTLKSTIEAGQFFGVSQTAKGTAVTNPSAMPEVSPWVADTDTVNVINGAFDAAKTVYFGYITNKDYAAAPTVTVTAKPFVLQDAAGDLASATVDQKVGYAISGTAEKVTATTVTTADSSKDVTVAFGSFTNHGVRGEEVSLTFTATEVDVKKAASGDYVATVTFAIASL